MTGTRPSMSRSSSQHNTRARSKRRRPDENDPLLEDLSRTPSVAASYRSFKDPESWSASSSTMTPSTCLQQPPEVKGQVPEVIVPPDDEIDEDSQPLLPSDEQTLDITQIRAAFMIISMGILLFLLASNISLLTTVQGVIATDLNAYESTTWFMSSYLLAQSSTGPVFGRISYIFSARWIIASSCLIIAIGTIVLATTPSVALFLLGRVLTGIGASGIVCVTQVLIQYAPMRRQGLLQGCLNTGFTSGVASGAILAGAIQPALGWRAIFWLQLPLTILGCAILVLAIPSRLKGLHLGPSDSDELPTTTRLSRIDYTGAVLLIVTITLLLYAIASPYFHLSEILAVCLSLALFLPLFIYQEAFRHNDPIVPIKVLSNIPVLFACLAMLGYMMSRWAVLFYTPVYGTAVRGLSPAAAGTVLVPTNVGFALGSLITGLLHIRRTGSFYRACLVIFTLFPLTIFWLATSTTATVPLPLYYVILLINGACAGAGMNYTLAHIQHLVHADVRLIVISLFFTVRGFAGTFGASAGGGIFNRSLRRFLTRRFHDQHILLPDPLLRKLVGSPRAVQDLGGFARQAAVDAYLDALRTLFFAGVALSLVTLLLQACTGWKGAEEREKERSNGIGAETREEVVAE